MLDHATRIRRRIRLRPAGRSTSGGWRRCTAATAAALAALTVAVAVSTTTRPGPVLHTAALFAHLAFLVLGFGAVLVADYSLLRWLLGRATFSEAMATTAVLHVPIWSGLAGLIASGSLLSPDLNATTTLIKLALVAVLIVNGVQASALSRRMPRTGATPPLRLLLYGTAVSVISQICWWGAVVIGFLHTGQ